MSFSQHFSEAVLPADSPPASWHLARTAATGWLRHLPDADASVQALAVALGLAPEAVRERLQATLRAYVADHWSDIEALGVSNFSTPRMQLLEAVRAGADPCATKQRRFPLVVHRVQEGIVAENFRVQARFRSLLHTARQLKNGAGDGPLSDPPSLLAAAQDALERGWRWGWSSFPPLRRCMPRLAPPVQLARAPSGPARRPRIVMLTGGMGAGKSTAIARLLQLENFVVIEADQFKELSPFFELMNHRLSSVELKKEVHALSTRAAEALLLQAVKQQRDIVFDSTLSWLPFALQVRARPSPLTTHHSTFTPLPPSPSPLALTLTLALTLALTLTTTLTRTRTLT